MNQSKIFHNRPILPVTFSIIFILVGVYILFLAKTGIIIAAVFILLGLVVLLTASTDTIRADSSAGILEIDSRSILKHSHAVVSAADIRTIEIESRSHRYPNEHTSGGSFRVVIKKKDGEVLPASTNYSNSLMAANNLCATLRNILNLNDPEKPAGLINNLMGDQLEQVRQKMEASQEALTGASDEIHETSGVHWTFEIRNTGGTQINHWHSADCKLDDHFVFIAQKVHGSANLGGFLNSVNKALFAQTINVYGYTDAHAPGFNQANPVDSLDPRLDGDYSGFSDTVLHIHEIVNPYVVSALAAWAQAHPLKQGSRDQLTVLVGPKGLYLAFIGLTSPDRLRDFTDLGVELVKSCRAGM